jgi:hypothetical protein
MEEAQAMKIAVISDIHDNLWALEDVLSRIQECDALFCLGDLCSPFVVPAIAERFGGPIHVVWGNNDGDKVGIVRLADQAGNVVLHGDFAEFDLGGRRIALTHYPHIGRALAAGQQYDLVCHGHDHQRQTGWTGRTLLLNPGEVMGRFGVRSCAVYDTDAGEAEILDL